MNLENLKKRNETLRKKAIVHNLKDYIIFGDLKVHPEMDISLLNDAELTIVHLFTHNSYSLSEPKYGKNNIKILHNKLVKEFIKREKNHPYVDFLDKIYK